MTERPPRQPPVPRLETFRPRDERIGVGPPPHTGPRRRLPQPRPEIDEPRRGNGIGRWLLITAGGLVLLAGAAVALATVFLPVGLIRDQLVREVKTRTGHDLVIAGPTSLSFWPTLAVSMDQVSLSSRSGIVGPPLITAGRIWASAELMPLLQRRIAIERVVLSQPVIELLVDAQGRRNWDFAALDDTAGPIRLAQAKIGPQAAPQSGQGPLRDTLPGDPGREALDDFLRNSNQAATPRTAGAPGTDVSIGSIDIESGTVRYRDARTGMSQEFKAVNAHVIARSLTSPLDTKGNLVWRGDRIDFDAHVTTPRLLIEQRPARLNLSLASSKATARFDGSLNPGQGSALDGTLKLDSPSLRALAGWLGATLPDNDGLTTLSLKSDIRTNPGSVALSNADLRLDDNSATGTLSVDLVAGRPQLKANLKLGMLDLNRYLSAAAATSPAPIPPPAAGSPTSIDDLLSRQPGLSPSPRDVLPTQRGPQVKGSVQRSGWSEDPINLATFGLLDAEAKLSLAGLAYRDLRVGATQGSLVLKSRALRITLDDMRLYDGQGRGTVSIDASSATPTLGTVLNLDGVSSQSLLKDAAGFEWIAGKAKFALALGGQGINERTIMESLNGKAELAVADGAIVGLDIGQLVGSLTRGRGPAVSPQNGQKTPFSEAGGSWQIKAGIADSKDIRLTSPQLRVAGSGTVNIGQRQVDTVLRSKLTGSQPGLGGIDLSAIEVPVRIKGSWEKPHIGADMDAVMRDPGKVMDTVKEVARQLGGKDGGGLQMLEKLLKKP